jgi:hypothetical protein
LSFYGAARLQRHARHGMFKINTRKAGP